MERKWYYAADGVRHGPVTFEELRVLVQSGTLKPLDLVWQPAFGPEWRNVGQVRELFEAEPEAPPPPPQAEARDVPLLGVTGARPSCLAAAAQAYGRTREVLFRPFDIGRWFSMGFCAWLASIGTRSTLNLNGLGEGGPQAVERQADGVLGGLSRIGEHPALVALAAVAAVIGLLLALVFCALRSRGDFMFLHRWYRPDAPIGQCWRASRAAGHELFQWRVYFFLIAALLFALVGAAAYVLVLRPYLAAGKTWQPGLALPAAACAAAALLLLVGVHVVAAMTRALVVPVMYWHGVTVSRAWLAVLALANQYPFALLGYLAWGAVCGFAAGLAIVAIGLLTCCVGFIALALPYFNAVFLLPVDLFFRGYGICFLSQWRHELVPDAA